MHHAAPSTLLFELIKDFGFNSETINDIAENINSQSGKRLPAALRRLLARWW